MTIRLTDEEFERLTGKKPERAAKSPKYRNRSSWYDGLHFQSDKELRDYIDHKNLLRVGAIAGFLWQGVLIVTEGSDKNNKAVTYRPDIVVLNNNGTYEIREDKGHRTRVYINKLKAIWQRYPRIKFKEVFRNVSVIHTEKKGMNLRDFIAKYWQQGFYALLMAVISGAVGWVWKLAKKNKDENDTMRAAMMALLRAEIISTYNHYEDKGYMPIYARENLHNLHQQYKELGGNGALDGLMDITREWPTAPPKEDD